MTIQLLTDIGSIEEGGVLNSPVATFKADAVPAPGALVSVDGKSWVAAEPAFWRVEKGRLSCVFVRVEEIS